MRSLLLLRHAKSDWSHPGLRDFDRPLNERGQRDARRMGHWMKAQGIVPQWVACSTARRARQTLEAMNESLALPAAAGDFTDRLYLADLSTLLECLAQCPVVAGPVMLVGHNPGLEDLLVHLCGPRLPLTDKGKLLTTANLAQLDLPDDWQGLEPSSGELRKIVRPRDLDD